MKGLGNARGPERRPPAARTALVGEEGADQRVDNFLLRELKGVPRSHIYRLLRGGEVRANTRRVDATYRLRQGDRVRISTTGANAGSAGGGHGSAARASQGSGRSPPSKAVDRTRVADHTALLTAALGRHPGRPPAPAASSSRTNSRPSGTLCGCS